MRNAVNTIKLEVILKAALIVLMTIAFAMAGSRQTYAAGNPICGLYDLADLLTNEEEAALLATAKGYCSKYECDIAIVTTNNAGSKTSAEYADLYSEELGMSMNREGRPGILFLIDMDNRQIYISTSGQSIYYFSDSRIDTVLDNCYSRITVGDYYGTCEKFLDGVKSYMGVSPSKGGRMTLYGLLIRLAISLAIGAFITFIMVKNAGGKVTTSGATYLDASNSKVTGRFDSFRTKTVTRRRIQKSNGGGHGGGHGGGSFHMSSGGGMHGGGGRGF